MFFKFSKKPTAIIFVDYEHWFISLKKQYYKTPDIKAWWNEVSQRYEIKELMFFADFSAEDIGKEIPKLREFTNMIIETRNTSAYYKKDFTDFIMLDFIYQRAMKAKSADCFIIFSGDSHFSAVASFLKNQCKKQVGIYGVRNACSKYLKELASWHVEIPEDTDYLNRYYQMILRNFKYLQMHSDSRGAHPTFYKTAERVADYNQVALEPVRVALQDLIHQGYVYTLPKTIAFRQTIPVLNVNWSKLIEDGLWKEEAKV